jgi:hypothetical protein
MWLLLSAALALDGQASASKEKKPAQPVVLTEEEKEIVKNRELLERLDLLRNFEKVRYLDFLAEKPEKKEDKKEEKPKEKPQSGKTTAKPK